MDSDVEDTELNKNMQLLNLELHNLIDDEEDATSIMMQPVITANSCASGVLREMNRKLKDLTSDENVPEFEFHGYGCIEAMSVLMKDSTNGANRGAKKKTKANYTAPGQVQMAPHQITNEQQQENNWQQNECADVITIHEMGNR